MGFAVAAREASGQGLVGANGQGCAQELPPCCCSARLGTRPSESKLLLLAAE